MTTTGFLRMALLTTSACEHLFGDEFLVEEPRQRCRPHYRRFKGARITSHIPKRSPHVAEEFGSKADASPASMAQWKLPPPGGTSEHSF